ncbi:Ion-translocating oxidoreductase complex subunit C [Gammaproteobacteria bacterium]
MKLFPMRGGVHPQQRKEKTREQAITSLPMPEWLYIPLQQHVGSPAQVLVAPGERVRKGQMIARCDGAISAAHHAPTSGIVETISDVTAPHPSGLSQTMIIIHSDGKDEWADLPLPLPDSSDLATIRSRVADSGVVGMGGAVFPAAVKLDLGLRYKIDTLVLNGAECEPYVTCDDRIMREYSEEVIHGAQIIARVLGATRIVVGIEDNKPEAIEAMRQAATSHPEVQIVSVPAQYPMGYAHDLILATTGRETPAGKRTAEIGAVAYNVGTARAVDHAVRLGRPLISRVVTVAGGAIQEPKNLEVPIGARILDLVSFCGGFSESPACIVSGGPMMGQPLPSLETPVIKGASGVLALSAAEMAAKKEGPCIRCGACIDACPCGLVPVEMAALIRRENLKAAEKIGVADCIGCGSCSWVCPSHIPLARYFHYANGQMGVQERDRHKNEYIRTLVEAHTQRMEKLAAAKRAAQAAKKAPTRREEATS